MGKINGDNGAIENGSKERRNSRKAREGKGGTRRRRKGALLKGMIEEKKGKNE